MFCNLHPDAQEMQADSFCSAITIYKVYLEAGLFNGPASSSGIHEM
jgi:hypothetical protein